MSNLCSDPDDFKFYLNEAENLYTQYDANTDPNISKVATTADFSTYKLVKRLGEGGAAAVYEGMIYTCRPEDINTIYSRVALKIYKLDQAFVWENEVLKSLAKSKNCHILLRLSIANACYRQVLVLPLCVGDLYTHTIANQNSFLLKEMWSILRQGVCALHALRKLSILHGDIKPHNVLIRRYKPIWISLCDFGMAKNIENSIMQSEPTHECLGTIIYRSPDALLGVHVGLNIDIFAFARVMLDCGNGSPFIPTNYNCPFGHLEYQMVHHYHTRIEPVSYRLYTTGIRSSKFIGVPVDGTQMIMLHPPHRGVDITEKLSLEAYLQNFIILQHDDRIESKFKLIHLLKFMLRLDPQYRISLDSLIASLQEELGFNCISNFPCNDYAIGEY